MNVFARVDETLCQTATIGEEGRGRGMTSLFGLGPVLGLAQNRCVAFFSRVGVG